MATNKLMLLLAELEAEVLEEALDLYMRARPTPADSRFEYRYRAARAVLDSLRQGTCSAGSVPAGDDEDTARQDAGPSERRSRREQLED